MIYQISSGQGPAECELGVSKLWDYLQSHYDVTLLDTSQGYYAETFRSIRLYSEDDLADMSAPFNGFAEALTAQIISGKTGSLTSSSAKQ